MSESRIDRWSLRGAAYAGLMTALIRRARRAMARAQSIDLRLSHECPEGGPQCG